jgi:hypothetical protein
VNAEKCTDLPEMAIESPLCGVVDAGLGSGLARVSDVKDNQIRLTGLSQHRFDSVADRHLMTDLGSDLGLAR